MTALYSYARELRQDLVMTYRTPRIHLSENELVNIQNGNVYSTLGPRGEPPQWLEQVPIPVRRRRSSDANDILPFPETRSLSSTRRRAVAEVDEDDAVIPFPAIRPKREPVSAPVALPRRKAA